MFGPGVAGVTGSEAILYLDLPSNMVSFSLRLSCNVRPEDVSFDIASDVSFSNFRWDLSLWGGLV